MIATDEFKGLQIFILGLGKTGLSILEFLNILVLISSVGMTAKVLEITYSPLGFRLKDLHKKDQIGKIVIGSLFHRNTLFISRAS